MTTTREHRDAHDSRIRGRRRWRCRCGESGTAANPRLALHELLHHDEMLHLRPERKRAAIEDMLFASGVQ